MDGYNRDECSIQKMMRATKIILPAFTLIEVMVVMAIIAIFSVIILIDWSGGRTAQQLDTASREVEAVIREAQNYALTGFQGGISGSEPCQFRVNWTGTSYNITYRYKNAGGVCDAATDTIIRPYTLKNGVTFSGGGGFYFSLPHAGVPGGNQTIVLTKATIFRAVCVSSGLISVRVGSTCP